MLTASACPQICQWWGGWAAFVEVRDIAVTTSHSPKYIWIIWGHIILIPLERHSNSRRCIRITRGVIKTKAFGSFLEGFYVIEGQSY